MDVVAKFAIWHSIMLVAYGITFASFIPIKLSQATASRLSKIFVIDNNQFQIDHVKKSGQQIATDLVYLFKLSALLFAYGNLSNRMHHVYQLYYAAVIISTSIIFGIIQQVKGMQTSCSCHAKWPKVATIFYSLSFATILIGLIYESLYLPEIHIKIYGIYIATVITTYFAMYLTILRNATLHLHHWYIGFFTAFLFGLDSIVINLYFSVLCGIFIQGICAYSATDIFYDYKSYNNIWYRPVLYYIVVLHIV